MGSPRGPCNRVAGSAPGQRVPKFIARTSNASGEKMTVPSNADGHSNFDTDCDGYQVYFDINYEASILDRNA